jgi:hypothetical protein
LTAAIAQAQQGLRFGVGALNIAYSRVSTSSDSVNIDGLRRDIDADGSLGLFEIIPGGSLVFGYAPSEMFEFGARVSVELESSSNFMDVDELTTEVGITETTVAGGGYVDFNFQTDGVATPYAGVLLGLSVTAWRATEESESVEYYPDGRTIVHLDSSDTILELVGSLSGGVKIMASENVSIDLALYFSIMPILYFSSSREFVNRGFMAPIRETSETQNNPRGVGFGAGFGLGFSYWPFGGAPSAAPGPTEKKAADASG